MPIHSRRVRWIAVVRAAVALSLGALAFAPLQEARANPPHVILVSLDGTRPVDVTEADLGSVAAFRKSGATATSMVPVSPSNTFPSHVSMITGVAPERHGLVNNRFIDPARGSFEKQDIPAWIEVEPLWSWLAGHGIVSASYYWVGSEGPWPPTGRGALHWKPFSAATGEREKVEQILAWLDLESPDAHPRFISSWFHGADHAGHHEGPGTQAARESLRAQDAAIAQLIEGLEARGAFAYTTLIFVSDHGMVTADRTLNLGSVLKGIGANAQTMGIGGFASVYLKDGDDRAERARRAVEAVRAQGLEAHVREQAPADWRVDHVRFGDVVVRAPVGTAIVYPFLSLVGFHGYDPDEASMRSIFMARGRGAVAGRALGQVHALDVAPTIVRLLGLEPPHWMEGAPIEGIEFDAVPPSDGSARLPGPGDDAVKEPEGDS